MATSNLNTLLQRALSAGLWIPALAAPVLIGSVHLMPRMGMAVAGALLLLLAVLLQFRRGRHFRVDGFTLIGLLLLGVSLFQLLPLSDGLLGTLSPKSLEYVQGTRALGIEVPGRISLDPFATAETALLILATLAFYLLAFQRAYHDGAAEQTLAMVGYSGAIVAVAALAHQFVGTEAIWGLFHPEGATAGTFKALSPFVNPNHAAGYLNLTGFVLYGVWQKAELGKPKTLIGFCVLLIFIASATMLSRGGLVAMSAGVLFLAFLNRFSGSRRIVTSPIITALEFSLAVLVAGAFLMVFNLVLKSTGGPDFLVPFSHEETKTQVWSAAVPLIDQFFRLGAGAGAFADAFSPMNVFYAKSTFMHAENELIEPLIEFGVPVGVILIGGGTLLFIRRLDFARGKAVHKEALCGLIALLLHNLADFSLRIPGVVLPASLVLGSISGAFARDFVRERRWRWTMGALKIIPLVSTAWILSIVGSLWLYENNPEKPFATMRALIREPSISADQAERTLLGPVLAMHPADSYALTLAGNVWASLDQIDHAKRALERARSLCPSCIPAQAAEARLLLADGEVDAALAIMKTIALFEPLTEEALFQTLYVADVDPASVGAVWGDDPDLTFRFARYLVNQAATDRTERLLLSAQKAHGWDPELMAALAELYLSQGHTKQAEELATFMMGFFPDHHSGFLFQARVAALRGEMEMALALYDESLVKISDPKEEVSVSLEILNLLANLRRWDRFEALAAEVRPQAAGYARLRSQFHMILARREEMRSRFQDALGELDLADAASPLDDAIAVRKASLYVQTGYADKAALECRKALRINPTNTTAAQILRDLEAAAGSQETAPGEGP